MTRLAVFSDVHGNLHALEAVRAAIATERPDAILIAGDHALNGPDPAGVVDGLRELEAAGALIVQGNTDIAVADFDFAAAFPWLTDGVPDAFVAAAEWAHDELGPERVDWLRRLPAERRLRTDDDTLVLVCHASPGSQTAGFDQALDPNVTTERVARTDARVILCGHTHLPEIRDLGWKLIVNDGSAGYVFDGEPTASWALVDIGGDGINAEIRRVEFDALAVATAISARGLPGDVYRAATVRTGKLVR
jgi:predicted phosphodiesterase